MGDRLEIIKRIIAETGESSEDAAISAQHLAELHPDLKPELIRWWSTGQIDRDREIAGYSINRLIAERHCRHVVSAIDWLDRLLRHPEKTIEMLNEPRCVVVPNLNLTD